MALPLLPLLLSTGVRQIAKRGVSKGLKYADRGLTGAMIVDSVNEASKGNYEGLTNLAQASLMGRMNRVGPIRKIDDYIVTKGLSLETGKTGYRKIISPRKVDTSKPLFEGRTASGTGAINRESGGSIARPRKKTDPTSEPRRPEVSQAFRGGKMVPVDKDGNLANYRASSGTGGMIRGRYLDTGKIDYRKDHPAYKDMIKQQQAQKFSDKKAQEFNIKQSLMKKDQKTQTFEQFKKKDLDVESELSAIEKFATKRIGEYKKKGDTVNRLFTTRSKSDSVLADTMKVEANRQGVPLKIETMPSKAAEDRAKQLIGGNRKYAELGAAGKSGKQTFLMDRDIQQEAMLRTMMQKKISKSGSSVGSVTYVKAESPNRTYGVIDYAGSLKSRVADISSQIARSEGFRRQKFTRRAPEVRENVVIASRPAFDTRLPSLMNKQKVRQDKTFNIKLDPKTSTLRIESNIVKAPKTTPGKQKFGAMKRGEMRQQVYSMLNLKVNIKQGSLPKSYKPKQPDLFKK